MTEPVAFPEIVLDGRSKPVKSGWSACAKWAKHAYNTVLNGDQKFYLKIGDVHRPLRYGTPWRCQNPRACVVLIDVGPVDLEKFLSWKGWEDPRGTPSQCRCGKTVWAFDNDQLHVTSSLQRGSRGLRGHLRLCTTCGDVVHDFLVSWGMHVTVNEL